MVRGEETLIPGACLSLFLFALIPGFTSNQNNHNLESDLSSTTANPSPFPKLMRAGFNCCLSVRIRVQQGTYAR